jgi:hypothetical protein
MNQQLVDEITAKAVAASDFDGKDEPLLRQAATMLVAEMTRPSLFDLLRRRQ